MREYRKVVIIGGGMMGVGLLYHLAEEGWTDVTLLEKSELTSGSTWHAAGQCPSFSGSYTVAKLHHYGNTLYPRLQEMTGQYVGWHGCGGLRIATMPQEVDWFRHVASFAGNVGFRMEVIGPDEIRKINPFLTLDGVLAAAWTLDDGYVDPAGCCNALATAAKQMGAEIRRDTLVTGIDRLPNGHFLVHANHTQIECEHVVNAAGCYARQIGGWLGVDVPITNMEHQYLVTESVKEFEERDVEIPVMRDSYTAGYYRQERKGALIGIYEHHSAREAWDHRGGWPEWSSSNELFDGDLDRLSPWLERVIERMPVIEKAGIRRVVNGAIPHTPDGLPLVGPTPGVRNAWDCCGASIGIAQGAGCGKYLAQWMVHGAADINMTPLDPRRFGKYADQTYTRAKSFDDYHNMFVTHLPGEERMAGRPKRTSPLYEKLTAAGAIHGETAGWERPKWFSNGADETHGFRRSNAFPFVAEECRAVREAVGILDLSGFAKFEVEGPDATSFLDRLLANSLPKREGGIKLCHMLSNAGRIEAEFTVTRLAADKYYVVSGIASETRDQDLLGLSIREGEQVTLRNVTEERGVLVVAGPNSRATLQPLTDMRLSAPDFPWMTAREMTVADIPVRALRATYVGELGWELHVPMDRLAALYDAVKASGAAHGIRDFGLYAIDSLRHEKTYRALGAELTNEIGMHEADITRFLAEDKGEFKGRAATLALKGKPIAYKLVQLEVATTTDADARGGEPVTAGDNVVGVVTSGGYGHFVKKSLAFAYVKPEAMDLALKVSILGVPCKATLLTTVPHDPEDKRPRA